MKNVSENTKVRKDSVQRVPVLRFPEFSGAGALPHGASRVRDTRVAVSVWEEKKLGEVFHIVAGKSKSEYFDDSGENIIVDMGGISSNGKLIAKKRTKCSRDFLKENDLVMPKDDIGGGFIIGRTARIPENEKYVLGDHVFRLSARDGVSLFYHYAINTFRINKEFRKKSNGTAQLGLSKWEVENQQVVSPSLSEQKKIADFLGAVDEWIGVLREERDALTTYKRGVMQRLFSPCHSREGGNLGSPCLRFHDDNGNDFPEWEEKKLGEIGASFNGLTGKSAEDFGQGSSFITYKQIFDSSKIDISKFEKVSIKKEEKQNKVRFGDIFFTTSSETSEEVGYSSVLLDKVDDVYLNSFCFGYRPNSLGKLGPSFARFYFRSDVMRKNLYRLAQGSTRFNLSKKEFMKIEISFPCAKEQKKIADFLGALDELITAKSDEISHAEEWKRGLMQKMFV